jgi:hypothetical protein
MKAHGKIFFISFPFFLAACATIQTGIQDFSREEVAVLTAHAKEQISRVAVEFITRSPPSLADALDDALSRSAAYKPGEDYLRIHLYMSRAIPVSRDLPGPGAGLIGLAAGKAKTDAGAFLNNKRLGELSDGSYITKLSPAVFNRPLMVDLHLKFQNGAETVLAYNYETALRININSPEEGGKIRSRDFRVEYAGPLGRGLAVMQVELLGHGSNVIQDFFKKPRFYPVALGWDDGTLRISQATIKSWEKPPVEQGAHFDGGESWLLLRRISIVQQQLEHTIVEWKRIDYAYEKVQIEWGE